MNDPRFVACETLITFLTIENNNINNYIVTFEYMSDGDSIRNSCDVLLSIGWPGLRQELHICDHNEDRFLTPIKHSFVKMNIWFIFYARIQILEEQWAIIKKIRNISLCTLGPDKVVFLLICTC